jgi:hypothetical protein
MVKIGTDKVINPAYVSHMVWDHRLYANGPVISTLAITMACGEKIHVKHEPNYYFGYDAYKIEKEILDGLEKRNSDN